MRRKHGHASVEEHPKPPRRPNLLYSVKEYAARLVVPYGMVCGWIKNGGLPTSRDWLKRPAPLGISPLAADTWVKRNGWRDTVLMHPAECVYFVRRSDGRFKIGFTNHLDRRFRELRSEALAAGMTLELIACRAGDRALERDWHEMLDMFALGEEWFHGDAALELAGQLQRDVA